ncbi:T9SS type B sorting domain-containing protein [Flavobacterium sp.]|uniref:T9SS type B sorting domain-containing protein n=1 Tax=Flavobacterium sp. TaxID=239 RepID=UPI00286E9EEC|nr:T9SS type B sorting domain-containing protein [Flavobacterium sp.]
MKFKNYLLTVILLLSFFDVLGQNLKPFTPRFDRDVNGDMLLIGNNILNRDGRRSDPNDPYNGGGVNGDFDMQYIDIDTDASTFSSSSANLDVPNYPDAAGNSCYRIIYAGLYWGAILQGNGSRADINKVKFKLPTGGYNDIVGQIVHDTNLTPIGGDNNKAYACYADVTSLLNPTNPEGTYTVANVLSSTGSNGGTGLSAGWTLYIVYEDPTATSKSIVSFDGFSGIDASNNLDINVTGFRTIPAGPVNAKLAFSAIEGDQDYFGDYLQINGTLPTVSSPGRVANNFFNSSVSTPTGPFLNRTPNSTNTLGYDAGVINIDNPTNSVIANGATSAVIRLGSNLDFYFYFFNAFAVDIIAPKILLTKQVRNTATGVLLAQNGTVNLGDYLTYEIGFQNTGNDDATSFTIRDILPINVTFNPLTDLTLPPGVTLDPAFLPYNPVTRTLGFIINNSLVQDGDPRYLIQIRVRVVTDCNLLSDVCSNLIQNQAFATYSGTVNTSVFSDEGSIASFGSCNIAVPNSTNFLANIDNCVYAQNAVICGNAGVQLTAANGYTSYAWTGPSGAVFTPNATSQSVNVNIAGVYTVVNTAAAPCRSIVETFTVTQLNPSLPNPVIDDADIVVNCVNDNVPLPQIFLCGAGAFRDIDVNITGAISIVWQKLNEPCTVVPPTPLSCANTSATCSWTQIATGANYTATIAGQYRILITFAGNCVVPFYFNVYQDILNPTATPTDIICTTPGQIIVNGVPSGYEYSLSSPTGVFLGNGSYVPGNVFNPINVPGNYTVFIRQTGITGGCVFQINNINIRLRDFSVTATPTQPLCNGGTGSVLFAVNNVEPQYTYMLYQGTVFGGPLVNQVVASANNTATFTPLNPGNYFYVITTDEGCRATGTFTINNPPVLTITAGITRPLTPCTVGEITVYPVGGTPVAGTPPYYFYYVNSTTLFQTSPIISAPTAGNYSIYVVDANNCRSNTVVINVPNNPPPVFAPTRTNVLCYGNNTGQINFNVSNANGYSLEYSINGGITYTANQPIFSNLIAGTYSLIIRYTLLNAVCLTTPQTLIITQPFEALTASGGIAQVACATNGGNAIVRITNVQGGTLPYQYNFGAGYQALNTGQLPPGGPYTIYVRDANLCVFPMTVTIDPIPAPPTITIAPPSFSCNGSATSTVTVNNILPGQYTYSYALDGVLNTPPTNNIFTNVPCGPHNIDVNYNLVAPPTFSNLLNETFGSGANTTTPGIAAAYCWNNQPYAPNRPCGNSRPAGFVGTPPCNDFTIEDNEYDVTSAINPNNCAWFAFRDHTSNATDPNGRFLAINIGSAAGANGVLYSKVINNILPNQPVIVEAYVANLFRANHVGGVDPSFSFELVDGLGNILAQQPPIPPTPNPTGIPPIPTIPRTNTWQLRSVSLNPGNNTTLTFRVRSGSILFNGNDALVDDIRVYQLPATCLTTRVFPIAIPCNQAFTAQVTGHRDVSCFGANDGTVTIAAQNFNVTNGFQYNVGNGWVTSLVSPVTVPINLATYTPQQVQIRYDSNPANAACIVTILQVILVPSAIVASASATAATCLVGATVTASATGGTGAYQYQLTGTTNPVTVPISIGYQNSPTFNNIAPGTYTVNVRDANGCIDPINTPIVIAPVGNPTLSLTGSNLCINPSGQASIVLTGSGGSGTGYVYAVVLAPGPLPSLSGYISTNTFPITVTGTYLVSVADSNGCISTATSQIIRPPLSVSTVLTNGIDCIAPTNALISGTITGGAGPYTVTPNTGVTVTGSTFTFTTNTGGNYQFTVTDAVGCTVQSIAIPVINYGNPTATQITTPASCVGFNTGSATVTPSAGLAPYTVTLNAITDATSPFTFVNLGAGTYPYTVTDANGCTFSGSAVVAGPAPIVAIANITVPYSCDNGATIVTQGTATLGSLVTGGTGTYSYSLYLGATLVQGPQLSNPVFTNILTPGSYTIRVTDTNGCLMTTNAVVIDPLNGPTDLTFTTTGTITCPSNTITINVALAAGGLNPVRFQIISPFVSTPPSASGVFMGLSPGTYIFEVTDRNNCKYQESYTINPLPTLSVIGNTTANIRCKGEANGSGTFTVSGTTNYTYTIAPFAGYAGVTNVPSTLATINLTGLIAGTYNITIRDVTTTCTATGSFTVNEPAVALAFTAPTIVPIQCSPSSGSVSINTVGGWPGSFTYTMTQPNGIVIVQTGTPPTANTFNNLTQGGTYTISVRDFNGCTITSTFPLTAPATPLVVISPLSDLCFDSVGLASITAVASIGVAPYTFSLNGGAFAAGSTATTITYNGLAANTTYTIIARDAFGCQSIAATQTINPQLTLTFGVTKPLDCSASPNAVINGIISGGTAPYFVTNTGVGTLTLSGSTFTFSTAVDANYSFTVTDSTGATLIPIGTPCTVTQSTAVSPRIVPDIVSAVQSAPILCNGASTGSLTIVVNSGLPYVLNVFNNTTSFNYGSSTTGLPAGNYTITATIPAPNSCFDTQTVTIVQPDPITFTGGVVQIICQAGGLGNSVGEVTATGVAGGTGLYTYTLINNATGLPAGIGTSGPTAATSYSFVLTNTAFGSYTIRVSDANGCSASSIQIIARPVDDIITTSVLPSNCTTASLKVCVSALGGPYYFAIYTGTIIPYPGPPGTYQVSDSPIPGNPDYLCSTFTGLLPDTLYSFVVYDDATKCYYQEAADTPTPTSSTMTSVVTPKDITCSGAANGDVSFVFSNNYPIATNVNWQVFNVSTTPVLPILTGTVTGLLSTPLPTTIINTTVTSLVPVNTPGPLAPGTYYIQFTEIGGANPGCIKNSAPFTIEQSLAPLTLSAVETTKDSCETNDGVITATAQFGTPPYLYQIAPDTGVAGVVDGTDVNLSVVSAYNAFSATFSAPANLPSTFNQESGNYIVYVKDAKGCIVSDFVNLGLFLDPAISAALVNPCVTQNNFSITATITSALGVPPYSVTLDSGAPQPIGSTVGSTFTFNNVSSLTSPHSITINDSNGCGNTVPVAILNPLAVTASFTTPPTCANPNGVITPIITALTGTQPSPAIALFNPTSVPALTFSGSTFINVPPGTYVITVTDPGTGCPASTTVSFAAPTPVTFTAANVVVTAPNCAALPGDISNGTLTVNLPAVNNNPVYTYTVTQTFAPFTVYGPQSSNFFTGLVAGTYSVRVDSGTCTLTVPVTIPAAPVLGASTLVSSPTCSPTNTLVPTEVSVFGSGGSGTYFYSTTGAVGTYFATNIFYVIDTGAVQNLTYFVKDSNGCETTTTAVVNPFPKLISAIATQQTRITCDNAGEVVLVTVAGGSTPLSYTWEVATNGAAFTGIGTTPFNTSTFTYPIPTAGTTTYQFQIVDVATGCSILSNVYNVPVFNTLVATANTVSQVDCFGNSTGTIALNVTGYTGSYTYQVLDSLGNPVLTAGASGSSNTSANPFLIPAGFPAGSYTVFVDQGLNYPNCDVTSNSVTIGQPAAATTIGIVSNTNANCNSGAIVTVQGANGTPGYGYAYGPTGFVPSGPGAYSPLSSTPFQVTIATAVITPAFDGYVFWVRDSNGCENSIPVQVSRDPDPTISLNPVTDQCTSNGSSYTFTVSGTGVGLLTYAITAVNGTPVANPYTTSTSFTVPGSGLYTVSVKDGNGCIVASSTNVDIKPPLTINAVLTTETSCIVGTNGGATGGVITVTTTGGSGSYSYILNPPTAGVIPVAPNTFTNVPSGSYTVTVTDLVTLCPLTSSTVVVGAPTPVTFNPATIANVICIGDTNGTIQVNLAPGNNNLLYTYTLLIGGTATPVVTTNNPNNFGLFTGLGQGTYDVTVTSGRGCTAVQTGITVGQPTAIILPPPTVTEFGCNPGTNTRNNATIVVNGVSGGNGAPFTYQLLDPLGNVVSSNAAPNSFTISNLLGGIYSMTVFDRLGCPAQINVPVNAFISLDDINIAITPITCLANEDISITVSTTGGTPVSLVYTVIAIAPITNTYNQTITTGGPGVFTGLPIGDYNITVTNPATGCTINDIHFVFDPNTLDVNVVKVSDAICVGDASGSVTLTLVDNDLNPTNDAGPFTFAFFLASDTTFSTPLFPGSSPNAGPTPPITGFVAGLYNVRVISPSPLSCPVISSFLIDEPSTPLSLNLDQTLITCAVGNTDGAISAVGQGGWTTAPYEYQLTCTTNPLNNVAYSQNGNFTGLGQGTYIVTVRDAKGCEFPSLPIVLAEPLPIGATVTPGTNPLCFGGTSSVTIDNIFGGQGSNYAYTIKGPINSNSDGPVVIAGTGPVTINNLVEGNYEVLITDGWLCVSNPYPFTINAPDVVTTAISTTQVQDCAGNATITLTGLGGTAPYSFSTTATGVYTPFISGTTTTFNIVATNVPFQYFVKDTNGCDALSSASITVAPLTPFSTSAVSNNIALNCVGDSNATINVSALGGLGNYTFTLLQGVTPISNNTTGLFTGLGVGNYSVVVTSGAGVAACPPLTEIIVISNPANPFLVDATPFDVTCNGINDGNIVLVISGATSSTVQYQITTWAAGNPDFTNQPTYNLVNNTITNLPPGTYAINVLNGTAGCPVVITGLVINEPLALDLQVDPLSINQEICSEDNDGAFDILVAGGILPYSISIDGGVLIVGNATQTLFQFSGLDGGDHIIKVVDGNLCDSAELKVPLNPAAAFKPEAQVIFECGPTNKPFVRVVVLDINNPAPFDFVPLANYEFALVVGGVVGTYQPSNVFTSDIYPVLLTPGIYSISVQNTNTCTKATQTFEIFPTDVDELTVDLVQLTSGLNEIIANANGGSQGYTYTFNGIDNGSDNTFVYTYTGDYTVVVTDSSGCTATDTKPFVFIPLCIPNVFTPNGDGQNDGWTPGCSSNYKDLKTYIYDRYGRKIVTLSEGELWDGTYNNQELPSGDYWYVIKVNEGDDREYVGHFTLYR